MKKKILIICLIIIVVMIAAIGIIIKINNKNINKENSIIIDNVDITEYTNSENPFQLIEKNKKKYMLLNVKNYEKKIKQIRSLKFLIVDEEGNTIQKFDALPKDILIQPNKSEYFLADLGDFEIKDDMIYSTSEISYLLDSEDDIIKPVIVNGYDISVYNNCKANICFNDDGLLLIKVKNETKSNKKYEKCIVEFWNNDLTEVIDKIEIKPDKKIVKPGKTVNFVTKLKNYNDSYDITKIRVSFK